MGFPAAALKGAHRLIVASMGQVHSQRRRLFLVSKGLCRHMLPHMLSGFQQHGAAQAATRVVLHEQGLSTSFCHTAVHGLVMIWY